MAKGKIKFVNLERRFGFIQAETGEEIHFALKVVQKPARWEDLQPGLAVTFEATPDQRGLTARWVTVVGFEKPSSVPVQPSESFQVKPGYRFLNPYNFVRYLDKRSGQVDEPGVQLMGRCPPPPHDRWVGLSGRITCRAEAITPLFISDSEDVTEGADKHRTYRFFKINGQKAIPASSLRGPIRSVFEAITNSCFATFGADTRLSYRLDARDARRLVPARIEKNETGWQLRLLTGRAELEVDTPPHELYPAAVRLYKARKPTGRKPQGPPPPPVDLSSLGPRETWHGQECWAIIMKIKFPPSWRVIAVVKDQAEAEKLKRTMIQSGKFRSSLEVQKGYLCITNQNADNKHSERFFFAQPKPGWPETISLLDQVRENYEDLIADYQDRHERTVKKWQQDGHDPSLLRHDIEEMAFSRFILSRDERSVKGDELVYAMLRGHASNLEILFIAPVSVPRVAYNHTIGNLLPNHLHRCKTVDTLCPACRMFGWVQGEREEGAYAGRVRFSHARLEKSKPEGPMRLAILGSPKPTTTRFYLVGPKGQPSKSPREDDVAGYDGNNGQNRLRGRKMYRYYQPDPKQLHVDTHSDQNRTIEDPEGAGAIFTFDVTFENLAPVELGALLWTLEIGKAGYHRLGYGKPLGLGSMDVKITELRLRDVEARYTSLEYDGWSEPLSEKEWHRFITMFQRAMVLPYPNSEPISELQKHGPASWKIAFEDLPNIKDLLTLLRRKEPTIPVHYPKSPEPDSKGQFEWFVGNKRPKGPKVELALPVEDQGLPLIDKQGRKY